MPHARLQRPATFVSFGRQLVGLCAAVVLAAAAEASPAEPGAAGVVTAAAGVQRIVDGLRADLSLSHAVAVELVEHNPLKASVEPVSGAVRTFRLSIEQGFLEQLTAAELRAVIAHELGHVWIYTHHPFLQTEQLANQVALRVVTRADLDNVYGKVWPDARSAGTLPRFPEAQPAVAAAVVVADAPAPRP